jgi:tRNA(Ile)-lysidine synthase TilS/MesJ
VVESLSASNLLPWDTDHSNSQDHKTHRRPHHTLDHMLDRKQDRRLRHEHSDNLHILRIHHNMTDGWVSNRAWSPQSTLCKMI